jgi:anti-sigma B factor antagonist
MELTFQTRASGAWTIVGVAGELDLHTSPQLASAISGAVDAGAVWLALDLSQVPFMDSSSLGVVVASLKRVREKGGDMALIGLQGSPAKVMRLTGLDSIFLVIAEESELPSP